MLVSFFFFFSPPSNIIFWPFSDSHSISTKGKREEQKRKKILESEIEQIDDVVRENMHLISKSLYSYAPKHCISF